MVTLEDIAANDHNLNIPRYVEPKNDQEVLTVDEAMKGCEEKRKGWLRRKRRSSPFFSAKDYYHEHSYLPTAT